MPTRAIVWFKRDLRVHDHAALAAAAACDEAAALYVVEPEWLTSPECDAQHVAFARACVTALADQLHALGMPLLIRVGAMPDVLDDLHRSVGMTHLFSHEETGPGWSYARDLRVAAWCRARGVAWHEAPQTGVVRRLRSRTGWAKRWQQRMSASQVAPPLGVRAVDRARECSPLSAPPSAPPSARSAVDPGVFPSLRDLGLRASRPIPAAGAAAAHAVLDSFLMQRGQRYRFDLSSPLSAEQSCSRLSPHLAFGTISMRQVHQATEARVAALKAHGDVESRAFAHHLRAFSGRLRWHCHFMQKLEDEPEIEHHNLARSMNGLRNEDSVDRERFTAWCEGRTGYPMVDACMRQLNATGWINFRMRAMLVSFAAYHLWLHWREPGLHLARQFLDFEPGIHWSQMQMQSGTTGINTLRIYSPAKQAADHDPRGEYLRRWLPEWGSAAYPQPIIDEKQALAHAKTTLYDRRRGSDARSEADAIQHKHGSRKSGLAPSGKRTKPAASRASRSARAADAQIDLFDVKAGSRE